jgi:hypothetical protein
MLDVEMNGQQSAVSSQQSAVSDQQSLGIRGLEKAISGQRLAVSDQQVRSLGCGCAKYDNISPTTGLLDYGCMFSTDIPLLTELMHMIYSKTRSSQFTV